MKKWFLAAVAVAIASFFNLSIASANDGAVAAPVASDVILAGDCCGDCCCDQSAFFFDFEATFLRYHRADGLLIPNAFGFEFAPRFTLGYVGQEGLGYRLRYWSYDHTNEVVPGVLDLQVDTQNLDLETFASLQVDCNTSVEWSVGLRLNSYEEVATIGGAPVASHDFNAPGLILGLRLDRKLPICGSLYAGARTTLLMSDWEFAGAQNIVGQIIADGPAFDVTRHITELSAGYRYDTCLSNGSVFSFHAGVEMQNWANFGNHGFLGILLATPVDTGFGGFAVGSSLTY